jgi:hypothetical protein
LRAPSFSAAGISREAKTKRNRFYGEIMCFVKPLIFLRPENAGFLGLGSFQGLGISRYGFFPLTAATKQKRSTDFYFIEDKRRNNSLRPPHPSPN